MLSSLLLWWHPIQAQEAVLPSQNNLVGNVYGTVVDAMTLHPISGADILLFHLPLAQPARHNLLTSVGHYSLPDLTTADRYGVTDEQGQFLINFVPTPFPFQHYLMIIRSVGHSLFIIDQARVLPGAVMALKVDAQLMPSDHLPVYYGANDPHAPLAYRHEGEKGFPDPRRPQGITSDNPPNTYTIFATREGLVGGTTANGHVILSRDHFVALPSRRALNANDKTTTFQVELSYQGRTTQVPVWDIGPWNIRDDYWNPASVREMWSDLPEGMPEAQAAFQSGYHDGLDDGLSKPGRKVLNAAGIDLGDGTYWDDLGMNGNGWITVKFLWRRDLQVGDTVRVTATSLNVRSSPGGSTLRQKVFGEEGKIINGPKGATSGSTFYIWWEIQWEDGLVSGWSAENFLENVAVITIPRLTIRTFGQSAELALWGTLGGKYGIQSISDLSTTNVWLDWISVTLTNNPAVLIDPSFSANPKRFYRARTLDLLP